MTRARLLSRFVIVGCVFAGPALATSCGNDDKSKQPPPSTGGSAGMAAQPEPITCGSNTCNPLKLPPPNTAAPCCAADDGCGIDATPLAAYGVTFADACQPRNQAGDLDPACPQSPDVMIPNSTGTPLIVNFQGCCHTDTNTCGYMLDKIGGLFPLGLGCVDSTPFLDGGTPGPCGAAGAAGSSN